MTDATCAFPEHKSANMKITRDEGKRNDDKTGHREVN